MITEANMTPAEYYRLNGCLSNEHIEMLLDWLDEEEAMRPALEQCAGYLADHIPENQDMAQRAEALERTVLAALGRSSSEQARATLPQMNRLTD